MSNGIIHPIPYIILLRICFIEAFIVLNTTQKTRSGGHPKFPPLFQLEEGIENDYLHSNYSHLFVNPPPLHVDRFNNIRCNCGQRTIKHYPRRSGKIIGGGVAIYGAYPWQVEIQIYNEDKNIYEHQCGGALIGDRLVLTAAHCIYTAEPHYIRLVIGNHDLSKRDEYERTFRVDHIELHPDFRKSGPYSNDIAIIKMRTNTVARLMFNSHIQPICLPKNRADMTRPGTWCTVTGWGAQNAEDRLSLAPVLRAAAVPLLDTNLCRNSNVNGDRQQYILDTMLCAGFLQGGVDACGGDSGSPLACEYNEQYFLAGLVSWGDGCAQRNRPGVYTRVDSYLDWINYKMDALNSQ